MKNHAFNCFLFISLLPGICISDHVGLDADLSFINNRTFGFFFFFTNIGCRMSKVFYAIDILMASLRNSFALGLDFGGK